MTYKELICEILENYSDKLDDDVTIYSQVYDEYYPIQGCALAEGDDVLSKEDLFIIMED